MASYDGLRHISIGQYLPTGSYVHRVDSRIKLGVALLVVVCVAVAGSYTANLLLLLAILGLVALSRLSLGYVLAGLRPALPVIAVLAFFQLLVGRVGADEPLLISWGFLKITSGGIRLVLVSLSRFVVLLCVTSLLTSTTTTSELTHGIESVLRPFSRAGLPGHELALVGAIALRFLPILGEQLESIMQAQASRGADVGTGGRLAFVRNARRVAAVIVPLFVDAYRRAEEMTLAMRARCYGGGRGRTRLVALSLGRRDYFALGIAVLCTVVILTIESSLLP